MEVSDILYITPSQRSSLIRNVINGSSGRTRTYNLVVNSHPLCRLSYRGAEFNQFSRKRAKFQSKCVWDSKLNQNR